MKQRPIYILITSAIVIGLLSGCAVGPNFKRPPAPDTLTYTATSLPSFADSSSSELSRSQRLVEGAPVTMAWWQGFGCVKLNALIDEALHQSPTLVAAEATLRQAQERYAAQAGSTLYPHVETNLTGQRQRFSPNSSGLTGDSREFGLYNASIGVRYNFDLAGGNRRALEALAARSDYQHYQLQGARLTLVNNIVTTAINQARLAAQMEATAAIVQAQSEQLKLTEERVRLGQAAPDEVLPLKTQMEQTRANMPLFLNLIQQNQHLLAVLVGRPPSAAGDLASFALHEFTLPAVLPLTIPSELVRTRPDIQAAQALLHAANAEYGVAVANLYPQLNLSANIGSQALTTGALFGGGSAIWNIVGQLTQPLFDPGLPAEKRAALAAFDAAAANYQTVVLESLRNVADVLRSLENNAQRLNSFSAANAAAQDSLLSKQRQHHLGSASYVELLIAQQQAEQTQIELITAQAQRLFDSVALFVAMGGETNAEGKNLTKSPSATTYAQTEM